MSSKKNDNGYFSPSWDLYSLGIIAFFLILQISAWSSFPLFIDIYYHLAAMAGFNAAGGYVTHGFWEYAPVGRPNLYPPLLHMVMLLFHNAGFSKIFIARFLNLAIFPLALFTIWFFIKNIYSSRSAFFSVLVASSVYSLYLALLTTIPASLSVLLGLASFVCVKNNRPIAAAVLLAYSFYSHALMPWIIVLSFLGYAVLRGEDKRGLITTIAVGIVLALPLLLHQYKNRAHFALVCVGENRSLEINVLVLLTAAAGLIYSLRRKGNYYLLVSLFLGFLALLHFYKHRYFTGQGVFGLIFLSAAGLDFLYEKMSGIKQQIAYLTSAIILFSIIAPVVFVDSSKVRIEAFESTLARLVFPIKEPPLTKGRSVFFEKSIGEIIETIKGNSSSEDIICSNFDYFAGMLGVFSGRATSNAMLREVLSDSDFDRVGVASLVIWIRDPDRLDTEPRYLIARYGLRKIKDTPLAFIYKNPHATSKMVITKPLISANVMLALFFISLALVLLDILRPAIRL